MDDTKKRCGLCGLWLHLKMFTPDTRTNDCRSTYCVDCQTLISDTSEVMNPLQPHLADKVFCHHCHEFKERSKFSPDKRRRSGLYTWCRQCCATYQKERRKQLMEPYRRSKTVSLPEQMIQFVHATYGQDQTPLSVVRAHEDVAERLFKWFPGFDPDKLRRTFYDLCVQEANPVIKEEQT